MPLFDFYCTECRATTEKLVKGGTERVECPKCGGVAVRQVSAPGAFNLQGDGFYRPSAPPVKPVE